MAGRPSIYALCDPDGSIRYIGKANDPAKRLQSHMRDSRRRRTPVYDWIKKHGCPMMRVLEADCEDWKSSERRFIAESRARGDRLLNVADGGDEPHCPIEVRRENGRRAASIRVTNPIREKLRLIKVQMKSNLRYLERWAVKTGDTGPADRVRAKMRLRASTHPHICGEWANV